VTEIITCGDLRHRMLEELQARSHGLQLELWRGAPGSAERVIALAKPESIRRVMAVRLTRQPKPRSTP
jgi:hypothetical protein